MEIDEMGPGDNIDLSDEMLVAYIDGELDAAQREALDAALPQNVEAHGRLEALKRGGRPFTEAFDLLLDKAPEDQLRAMYADLIAKTAVSSVAAGDESGKVVPLKPRKGKAAPIFRMAIAAALLALVFTGGLYTGGFFRAPIERTPIEVSDKDLGWREAAARYVVLFSKETLDGFPADPKQREANLTQVQTALGLPLTPERLSDPALSFQGTQLLQLDGKPLVQVSYLYGEQTPVALCIVRSPKPPAAPETEKRHGLNIVHWMSGSYGFMVIGKVPEAELSKIAQNFVERFS